MLNKIVYGIIYSDNFQSILDAMNEVEFGNVENIKILGIHLIYIVLDIKICHATDKK